MPIYEYRCTSCQRTVEAIQKLNDPPLSECEACKGKLEKIVSRTAFHLKGGGWFDQGYSGGSSPASADTGSEPKTKSETKTKDKDKGKGEASGGGNGAKASSGGCGPGSCGCAH